MASTHWRFLVTVCAVALVVIVLYGEIPFTHEPYTHWDLVHYKAMAEAAPGLATNVQQPFCFRLLGPYLVGLLPLPASVGFYLFSIAASLVLVIMFYFFLCSQQIDPSVAAVTTALFTLNRYLFGLSVWDYFQLNDILALVFLIVLLFALYHFQWTRFSIILLLGILARETVLIIIPTAVAYLYERHRTDQLKWLAIAVVPCILVFVIVRTFVPVSGGNDLLTAFTLYAPKILSPETWYRLLINAFIPLTFLPILFWSSTRQYFSDNKHAIVFLVLVLLGTLFGENYERLMAPTFIFFYLLVARIIQKHLFTMIPLSGIVVGVLMSWPHHQIARYPLRDRNVVIFLSIAALSMTTLVGFYYRKTLKKYASEGSS
jgi:hypothetical protein